MKETAQEVINTLGSMVAETGAVINVGELPMIKADRVQMFQLLQNLLSNAIKFSVKSGSPRVDLTCIQSYDNWLFCVKDNGIGILPKYFDKIFVVFQKLHSKDEYEGSGIGLSICKKIVERHGGRIWVESEEGKGTSFYFTIPIG